jgi:hypothetical protein
MTLNRTLMVPFVAFVASSVLIPASLAKWGPRTDLQADTLALTGLLFGAFASARFYSFRKDIAYRMLCTFTILVTAFWALEFSGGVAFLTIDKLVCHFQKS